MKTGRTLQDYRELSSFFPVNPTAAVGAASNGLETGETKPSSWTTAPERAADAAAPARSDFPMIDGLRPVGFDAGLPDALDAGASRVGLQGVGAAVTAGCDQGFVNGGFRVVNTCACGVFAGALFAVPLGVGSVIVT